MSTTQTEIGTYVISNSRIIKTHMSIVEGAKKTKGIDIRKYANKGSEIVPTQKGIFLTKDELNAVLSMIGVDPNTLRKEIKQFLSDAEDKMEMLH